MIDKFETCQNCPDRKLYCHNNCKGYLYRRKKYEEIRKKKCENNAFYVYRRESGFNKKRGK